MSRRALIMQLKPGCEAEYKRRHDAIWPELVVALHQAGITDYSIFLERSTGRLFAVHRQADAELAAALSRQPIMRKWWDWMADLMQTHPDHAPVCIDLEEVFHLD